MPEKVIAHEIERLTDHIKGLRLEVEGWRMHVGSTGYFIQIAIEDLQKAVAELDKLVKTRAEAAQLK
jgi:hypothetical protein